MCVSISISTKPLIVFIRIDIDTYSRYIYSLGIYIYMCAYPVSLVYLIHTPTSTWEVYELTECMVWLDLPFYINL